MTNKVVSFADEVKRLRLRAKPKLRRDKPVPDEPPEGVYDVPPMELIQLLVFTLTVEKDNQAAAEVYENLRDWFKGAEEGEHIPIPEHLNEHIRRMLKVYPAWADDT